MIMIEREGGYVCAGEFRTNRLHLVSLCERNYDGKTAKRWEDLVAMVLGKGTWELQAEYPHPKDRYKYYKEQLGVSPKQFTKMWNAVVLKNYIPVDVKHIAMKYCRGRLGRYRQSRLDALKKSKDSILQLEKDGMSNLIPVALAYASNHNKVFCAKTFRQEIGKSMWKRLLRNSTSRSTLIAYYVESIDKTYLIDEPVSTPLSAVIDVPSSCIPRRMDKPLICENTINVLRKERKLTTDWDTKASLNNVIRDTKLMMENLEMKLPKGHTKYGIDDWKALHEKCIDLTHKAKYSDAYIGWLRKYDKTLKFKNLEAKVLTSKFAVKCEGEEMKHCVGGYADMVSNKRYVVWSITKDGKRYSTLGLHYDDNGQVFYINQHYKKCNGYLDNDDPAKVLANVVEKFLNGEKIDEKYFKKG